MSLTKEALASLTGLAAVTLAVVGILIMGDPPNSTEATAAQVVEHYKDNEGAVFFGSFLVGLSAVLIVFFGGQLSKALVAAERERGTLHAVTLAGSALLAVALLVGATLNITLADNADDLSPTALQAINAIAYDFFLPIAAGMAVFTLAAGIAIVRYESLPSWLGWVAVVIGIACATPAGFFASIIGIVWIAAVSVLLAVRNRAPAAEPVPA